MTQDIQKTAVVALFNSREGAEDALNMLNQEGVDMRRLSIFDKATDTERSSSASKQAAHFLVLVRGTAEMIVHARAVLGTTDFRDPKPT